MNGERITGDGSANGGSNETTLEDIYKDGTSQNPMTQNSILFLAWIFVMIVHPYLIWYIYKGTDGGMIEGAPWFLVVMLGVLVITLAAVMIVMTIYMLVLFQGDIKYKIDGEIQLDIAYKPFDMFSINPRSSVIIVILLVIMTILLLFSIFVFGSSDGTEIMFYFLIMTMAIKNFFSKRHYVFTDKGVGIITFGFKTVTMYMSWKAFRGFIMQDRRIRLHPKRSPILLVMFFPKYIPVLNNIDDARFVLQQYLSEL